MVKFILSEDNRWLVLTHSTSEVEKKQVELSLTKKIHNWYFHPLVKRKIWDGSICFVEKKGPFWRIPVGLWSELLEISKEYKYDFQIEGLERIFLSDLTLEDFKKWADEFFTDSDKKPRDYQIEAAWKIVKFRYSVSEIATSSGKTLISFMIFAFLKSKGMIRKFLMIVPSTNLVIQGTEDFEDYGINKLGSKIQQIGGGNKAREGCDVVIGTFQSLVKKEPEYFEEFDAVFIDEAHFTNSNSIKKIMTNCMHTGWRFGLTGTLTKRGSADHLTIQQFLGPVLVEISPDFLFRNNYATPVSIKIVILDWLSPEYKEKLSDLKSNSAEMEGNDLYNLERKLVISNKARLNYIVDFINKTSKNSLVLFQSVKDEYGKNIWNMLREVSNNKEVFYIDGDTPESLRDEYKKRMSTGGETVTTVKMTVNGRVYTFDGEEEIPLNNGTFKKALNITEDDDISDEFIKMYTNGNINSFKIEKSEIKNTNKIIVATYNCFSTGISINNLHNIFLVESYKSEVLIKQSLGRGMRKMDGKEKVNIIDFVDDFSTAGYKNYLMKHSEARIAIYKNENFEFKIYRVTL